MARRRHQEEHENHERWLVSYADFITLLFAFFVVMYSISSVNEGKYKILSETLTGVFNHPERSIVPIAVGESRPKTTSMDQAISNQNGADDNIESSSNQLTVIAQSVREAFADLIDADQLQVRGNELWIEIELRSSLLFGSGDALPNDAAFSIVDKIAKILAPYANPIHVEGFTDDRPINTMQFPSNWELSSARAASIVQILAMNGVSPGRMAAVGYAEFQPIADNSTAEGRARNRRVVLVISRNLDVRRSVSGVGSANAKPDSTLKRAGMQPATVSSKEPANAASQHVDVNPPSPVLDRPVPESRG